MMRRVASTMFLVFVGLSVSACVLVPKSRSSQPMTSREAPKNHGQERSQEVHERNAERKAAHDAEKGK